MVMKELALLSCVPATLCPPQPATPAQQEVIFNAFVQTLFVEKNASLAFNTHVSESYINHYVFGRNGRDQKIEVLAPIIAEFNFTISSQGLSNNYAWVHHRLDRPNQRTFTAVVDLFRFEGTCIMEHWDVLQELPENATNPIALF